MGEGSPGDTAFRRRFILGLVMCFAMNVAWPHTHNHCQAQIIVVRFAVFHQSCKESLPCDGKL